MANIITYVNTILTPYYKYMIILFLIIVFVMVARYAYNRFYVKKVKMEKGANVANANNILPIMGVYFFNVDWCPHCVNAKPAWIEFSNEYDNKEVNGYLVRCYDIDCTDDSGEQVVQYDKDIPTNIKPTPVRISELIKKFKIESYPTIKMTKDELIVDFEAKVTKDNLVQFVNSM